ncbi:MAG: hypothetical protein JW699_07565 [Chitinispirillaceae bacterium]|nr:hypothetical protein [Chitinispirillaceae bacterium]
MQKKTARMIVISSVFAVAMGFIEAAVVVYLREIYYPEGFRFPLQAIAPVIARIELMREAATIVMLLSIGMLAGRSRYEKMAYFIYCFGVWDIFYYVFLKLLIGWPESLFTWDILFLIPTIWVGPVLAPCINAVTMMALALVIVYAVDKNRIERFGPVAWSLLIAGALMILVSYLQGFVLYMAQHVACAQLESALSAGKATAFVPSRFNWPLFSAGVALHLAALGAYCRRVFRKV